MSAPRPLLLEDGNFTPRERTPWGGTQLALDYKPWLLQGGGEAPVIGESWEISVEPDFPSRVEGGEALADVIARDAVGWLGDAGAARGGASLLLKVLDADSPLSVQIHPRDDWSGLEPGQSGKPECWYILAARPGAHLLLGLAPGVDEARLRRALRSGEDVAALLGRVEVEPGDFFVIDAGLVHAVGAGITLIEPQRVRPGRRGVTLRFWDHGRRYDARGKLDPAGEPRALQVEEALAVTDWAADRGQAGLMHTRQRAGAVATLGAPRLDALMPPARARGSTALDASRVSGTGELELAGAHRGVLTGLFVAQGELSISHEAGDLRVPAGRSAVLPASLVEPRLALRGAHALLASVRE